MSEPTALESLTELERRAFAELSQCADEPALRAWNGRFQTDLGVAMKILGKLPPAEKKGYGQEANRVKQVVMQAYESSLSQIKEQVLLAGLNANPLDVTQPGRGVPQGRLHVATTIMRRISAIFADMGFQIYRTGEVEDDLTNFELLNMPPHHPARDMWDTFHTTTPGTLLRTHTSPGQIHVMRKMCPKPVRVFLPGMVYRYEQVTTRSEMMFHQVEGLVIGENVTMTDLKGTITAFARRLFGEERQIRIRSSYFPFTEPSIEVDIDWPKEDPNADRLTKGTGWLEIMGAGMVHPVVLRNGGYDPEKVSGFAFGLGPQRITMLKYAIDDIRQFWQNDLRFLRQF